MKNKVNFIITPILIRKLIGAIAVTILLICMILKSSDVKSKLFMLPFFVCGIFETGKIICLLMDKKKWSNIFGKLFTYVTNLALWFVIIREQLETSVQQPSVSLQSCISRRKHKYFVIHLIRFRPRLQRLTAYRAIDDIRVDDINDCP